MNIAPVLPGQEHDTTCLRPQPNPMATLAGIREDLRTLADLDYEDEGDASSSRSRN